MDSKKQDPAVASKNPDPENGELNDSQLAGVTGGTINVVQLAHDAGTAAAAAAGPIKTHATGPLN